MGRIVNIPKHLKSSATGVVGGFMARRTLRRELLPRLEQPSSSKGSSETLQNILQINALAGQGGAAKVASGLNGQLNSLGYISTILARQVKGDTANTTVLTPETSLRQRLLNNWQEKNGWLDFFYLSSLHIKDLPEFKNCDLVHLHNLHGYYFSLFALPELSKAKPTVWTLHDMQAITGHCAHSLDCDRWLSGCGNCPNLKVYPPLVKDTTKFLWQTKQKIYANSNLTIVCPSDWLKQKVAKSILNTKDIRLIYNGVDHTVFSPQDKVRARMELGLPAAAKVLMFSADGGAGNKWKGGHYLEQVYSQLSSRSDIIFVNIGGKGSRAAGNWLDIPYINDEKLMAKYYAAADLFLYPSLADTFPLVVLEALACGTPVIAFATGGIPEQIQHLETGYIAKYQDVEDLLKGTLLFLEDQALFEKVRLKAPQVIAAKFTLAKMTEQYVRLYEEVFAQA